MRRGSIAIVVAILIALVGWLGIVQGAEPAPVIRVGVWNVSVSSEKALPMEQVAGTIKKTKLDLVALLGMPSRKFANRKMPNRPPTTMPLVLSVSCAVTRRSLLLRLPKGRHS